MIGPSPAFPGAILTDELDLDALPTGAISRLRLQIAHDGLGRPVRLPVLVARGRRSGPVFGLTAAVHGNELNGIPVIHGLLGQINLSNLAGTIVAVVAVNVPGVLARRREFPDGRDLNHLFPGRPDGSASEVYAHRLMEKVVRQFDRLVDLHTASFGRVNSLYVRADMTDPVTARMATLQRPQIIVHNPPVDGTLRGAAQGMGIPSITVEIGNPHRFQRDYIKRSRTGLRAVLAHAGMLSMRSMAPVEPPLLCLRSSWIHTDHGGLLDVFPSVCDTVRKGDLVARLTSIYGDVVREYHAPVDGVIVGKSVDPVAETGARIAHVGVLAPPDHPFRQRQEDLVVGSRRRA